MSDLSVAISPKGLVGLENDKPHVDNANDVKKIEQIDKSSEITEEEPKEATHKEVEVALVEVNAFVQSMQRNLSFSIDEQLGQEIISVTDTETEEVIRQIPSEELVVLRKKMDDVVGILFDTKV